MSVQEVPPVAPRTRALSVPGIDDAERELLESVGEQVAKFLAREIDSAAIEAAHQIPARVREAAAAAGLFGLTIPESHGGLGLSLKGACHVVQQIAKVDRSVAIMLGLHAGLGTRGLVTFGSPEQKDRWLPALASGERIASFAATEAGAGSDLGGVRTVATQDGDTLKVTGEKAYVTNGGFAKLFTVLVATPSLGGTRAQSLVCIPRESPGIEIGPEEEKLGIRASSTVTVRFEETPVPMANILGEPGRGIMQAHGVLSWGRTLMAAGCVGTAEAALAAARDYVGVRRQFGRTIGEFGATRAHLAWMASRVFAMETLVRDAGECEHRDELESVSAMAKVFCSEQTFEVCDRALQLHGALGFIEPVGVARMLRDCRITRIFEGANDVLLVRLGAAMVSRDPPAIERSLTGSPISQKCTDLSTRWNAVVAGVRREYGIRAVEHQVVLQRIARAAIALHVADVVRIRSEEDKRPQSAALAALAVEHLVDDGHRLLDGLENAAAEEARVEAIVGEWLAPGRGRTRGGREGGRS